MSPRSQRSFLLRKLKKLKSRLKGLGSVLVAYSGGVDSTLLLKVAKESLHDKVLAVTALSETYPSSELACARGLAKEIGVMHRVIRTQELQNLSFRDNPANRCYYCKRELFSRLKDMAARQGLDFVIDGSNVDDLADYRPGSQAKKEFGIVSPLQEAGLSKKEIRELSRKLGLAAWSKPALACLASRVPYHSRITKRRLTRIDKAEAVLREKFGIKGNLRVRDYEELARIEVDKNELKSLADTKKIASYLRPIGYKEVQIDPKGYRMGSLNSGA